MVGIGAAERVFSDVVSIVVVSVYLSNVNVGMVISVVSSLLGSSVDVVSG